MSGCCVSVVKDTEAQIMETVMAMWGGQPRAMRWVSTAGVAGMGGWSGGGGRWRVGSMEDAVAYCGSRFDGGDGRCVRGGCPYL